MTEENESPRNQLDLISWLEWAMLALGGVMYLLKAHPPLTGDGLVRFKALEELLLTGGYHRTGYSLVGPLFFSPLWLLGQLGPSAPWWYARANTLLFLVFVVLAYRLLKDVLSPSTCRRFLLLLTYASMFTQHLQHFTGEVFTTLFVGIGTIAIARWGSWWGWACVILGILNVPACAVGLAMMSLIWLPHKTRWKPVLAMGIAAGLVLCENWLRRGDPFRTDYEGNRGFKTIMPFSGQPEFSYPLFFGVLGILFSLGKGLIYFTPGVFLPPLFDEKQKGSALQRLHLMWILFVVGLVLVYSRWWSWYGGWFWGPRLFLFACLPSSLVLALALDQPEKQSLTRNLLVGLALTLSFWVGYCGLALGQKQLLFAIQNNYQQEHLVWHVPEFSALWHPFAIGFPGPRWVLIAMVPFVLVYLWVTWPLFRTLRRQIPQAIKEFVQAPPPQ